MIKIDTDSEEWQNVMKHHDSVEFSVTKSDISTIVMVYATHRDNRASDGISSMADTPEDIDRAILKSLEYLGHSK